MKVSVGNCPVCAELGPLVVKKAKGSGRIFVHCEACDCAWDHVPLKVDEIDPPGKYAPTGHDDATLKEARAVFQFVSELKGE